ARLPHHGRLHGRFVARHRAGAGDRTRSGVHRSGWTTVAGKRSCRRREIEGWFAFATIFGVLGGVSEGSFEFTRHPGIAKRYPGPSVFDPFKQATGSRIAAAWRPG